jgi:hypothetical protein
MDRVITLMSLYDFILLSISCNQGVVSKYVYLSFLFNSWLLVYYSALGEEVADYDTIQ